jgi:hypothetical protein
MRLSRLPGFAGGDGDWGAIVYVLMAPWTFHLGGRWTPLSRRDGMGRLRDSAGAEYGLYVRIAPYMNIDFRNDSLSTCCNLSGKAQVCTAGGAPFLGPGFAPTAAR